MLLETSEITLDQDLGPFRGQIEVLWTDHPERDGRLVKWLEENEECRDQLCTARKKDRKTFNKAFCSVFSFGDESPDLRNLSAFLKDSDIGAHPKLDAGIQELIRSRVRSLRRRYARLRSSIGTEAQLLTVEDILEKLDSTMHTSLISKIVNFEFWGRLHLLWREDPDFNEILYDKNAPLRCIDEDSNTESLSEPDLAGLLRPEVNTTSERVATEEITNANATFPERPSVRNQQKALATSTISLKRKRGRPSSDLTQASISLAGSKSTAEVTSEAHLERMAELELKKRRIEEDIATRSLRETELKLNHEYNMGKQEIIMKALRLLEVNIESQKVD